MQPNDQQGYYKPGASAQPNAGLQPPTVQPAPIVDSVAPQVAPNEPVSTVSASQQPDPELPDDQAQEDDELSDEPVVTWVAHEYIHQEKGTTWFLLFGIVVVILMAVSIFVMGSVSFAILLAVIAVVVVVYSRRPPRELTYSLTDSGLVIDDRLHSFDDFKSFGVIRDGQDFSVMLIPTQRFQPGITVYFPEEQGEDIVDVLGSRLPMKDLKLDVVDRIVRLLRL